MQYRAPWKSLPSFRSNDSKLGSNDSKLDSNDSKLGSNHTESGQSSTPSSGQSRDLLVDLTREQDQTPNSGPSSLPSNRTNIQTQRLAKTRYECSDHRDELASANEASLSLPARFHVGQCLACQAEMANYKKLRRWMRTLTEVEAPSSSALADQISFALDQADLDLARRRIPNHLPAAIGVVSGGVAAAVGVFAVATRHKRVLRLPIPALST